MNQKRVFRKIIVLVALFLFIFTVPVNAAGYKKAYRKIVKQFEKDHPTKSSYFTYKNRYALIYIDKNKTPELVCDRVGYGISVYTYKKGRAKCLTYSKDRWGEMFEWSYGVMGNHGYYYIPRKNKVYNRNANMAGAEYIDSFYTIKNGRFKFKKYIRYNMTKKGTRLPSRKKYKPICGKYSKKTILKKLK